MPSEIDDFDHAELRWNVFVSSTVLDLPSYRASARDAAWRRGMFPYMMEKDSASPDDPLTYSMRLADQADIYVGVFGFRYGTLSEPQHKSITELEYRRAVERGIPVLIFLRDEQYPVAVGDVEIDPEKRQLLEALKHELMVKYRVGFFQSPENFGSQLYQALSDLTDDPHVRAQVAAQRRALRDAATDTRSTPLMPLMTPLLSALPSAPAPYIAHPYVPSHTFIGRRTECARLDAWLTNSRVPMLLLEALGGTGKSALTWQWMYTRAATEHPTLAGTLWWSFYESDSTVTNFLRHALAYVSGQSLAEVDMLTPNDRERALLSALSKRPYLIVLDGAERILAAYHRLDAAYAADEQFERVASQGKADLASQHLCRCTDPHDGVFLARLTQSAPSKVLITSRLIPADLRGRGNSDLLPGVERLSLGGLEPEDALTLFRELGVQGQKSHMLPILELVGYHPLVTEVLAGHIARYYPAPGDFAQWYATEGAPLRLGDLDLIQRRHHILQVAFAGLASPVHTLLCRIAAFRYPVEYAALGVLNPYLPTPPPPVQRLPLPHESRHSAAAAINIQAVKYERQTLRARLETLRREEPPAGPEPSAKGQGQVTSLQRRLTVLEAYLEEAQRQERADHLARQQYWQASRAAEIPFHQALSDLEARGLLRWDRLANRYDLHPVVRAFAFEQLEASERQTTFTRIHDHFAGLPPEDLDAIHEVIDLRRTLEIYHALLGGEFYDQAFAVYRERLDTPLRYTLCAYPMVVRLLAPLFPGGYQRRPILTDPQLQSRCMRVAASMLQRTGELSEALALYDTLLLFDLNRSPIAGSRSEAISRQRANAAPTTPALMPAQDDVTIAVLQDLIGYASALVAAGQLARAADAVELATALSALCGSATDQAQLYVTRLQAAVEQGDWGTARTVYQAFCSGARPAQAQRFQAQGMYEYARMCLILRREPTALAKQAITQVCDAAAQDNTPANQWAIQSLQAELASRLGNWEEADERWQTVITLKERSDLPTIVERAQRARLSAERDLAKRGLHEGSDTTTHIKASGCLAHELYTQAQEDLAVTAHQSDGLAHIVLAEAACAMREREQAKQEAHLAFSAGCADGYPYIQWDIVERAKQVLVALGEPEPVPPVVNTQRLPRLSHRQRVRDLIGHLQRPRNLASFQVAESAAV